MHRVLCPNKWVPRPPAVAGDSAWCDPIHKGRRHARRPGALQRSFRESGVEVRPVLVDHEDRVDGAVLRSGEDLVERRAVRIEHDGLVLLIELEDIRGRVDAVAEPVAELAIHPETDPVAGRDLRHAVADSAARSAVAASGETDSATASTSSWSMRRRSAACMRAMTRRCT